jgi:hypothetical protein
MARYRFCFLNAVGALYLADVFECPSDRAAKEHLQRLLDDAPACYEFELWRLNRLIYAGRNSNHRRE